MSLIVFEDEHLLAVNKPAGWNTHAPSPYAGEGIYEWLKHREPRWAKLAIIHRLDKETSGVLVFGKTAAANKSLTEQFTSRAVRKNYLLLTDRVVKRKEFTATSTIVRAGDKYVSRPMHATAELAETRFTVLNTDGPNTIVRAEPTTGRTHQIRVHAAEHGFPILGDTLYGGTDADRVFLHAEEISFAHPVTGQPLTFRAPCDWSADCRVRADITVRSPELRASVIDPNATDSFRLVHGASDGWPGLYVDRLGDFLLVETDQPLTSAQQEIIKHLASTHASRGAYHKLLNRNVRRTNVTEASPRLLFGDPAPNHFTIRENGLSFEMSFTEGYSVGMFLDQRDNRRRFLTGHVAADFALDSYASRSPSPRPSPSGRGGKSSSGIREVSERLTEEVATVLPLRWGEGRGEGEPGAPTTTAPTTRDLSGWEVLNTFAYTCGFSVAAAKAGARTTSLDLSKKYLEWGKRNFPLNGLDASQHDFIYGDAFDWMRRLVKKARAFDCIILDPPTFSQSKEGGTWQAEKHYGRLVEAALPLLKPNGVLLASTNAAKIEPEQFVETIHATATQARRRILQEHYVPQPPDFPISREEPAYLKTIWLRVS